MQTRKTRLSRHFHLREFASRDGARTPAHVAASLRQLCVNILEPVRLHYRGTPIIIVSGYRSPTYNSRVGGAEFSRHVVGDAADIRVRGISAASVYMYIDGMMRLGEYPRGGLGWYPTNSRRTGYVHVDMRGWLARWGRRPESGR